MQLVMVCHNADNSANSVGRMRSNSSRQVIRQNHFLKSFGLWCIKMC